MNWSGGKDSALCLHEAFVSGQFYISHLLTSVNSVHGRVSMHGVRKSLLEAQANAIGIPLATIDLPEQPGMEEYETAMMRKANELKKYGCTHALFGDIFLEDLKAYREKKLSEAGIDCIFPLWKKNTRALIREFIDLGFKAIIVCVNEKWLDKSFCGRIIDKNFLDDLPGGVDPCGENGEFHSFVFEAPVFKAPIAFKRGDIVYKKYKGPGNGEPGTGFYFCDLLPA
ncbi:MAG: diphthine--ammonia ligase [Bacteroidetes bacterium]|nr:diphthine--ammonia ligase [Bacteroidota bacterium]MBS1973581.1 diphthine--ammonia ligase [Bacteroidota bacterium]